MPMSTDFEGRLTPILADIASHFGTPFHIYDEAGLKATGEQLITAFSGLAGFKEYFAVKALPNPRILEIMRKMGFGFDCSSIPELALSRKTGATGDEIMFSSNNTHAGEFAVAARNGGCILNLDDLSLIDKVPRMPELICFRYNPGERRTGNAIIGNPVESKYGLTHDQLPLAFDRARERGARRFGLHAMVASNERNYQYMVETARMLLDMVESIGRDRSIRFEFINIGGGLGIPYHPDDAPLDLGALSTEIKALFRAFEERNGYMPRLYMESGRYMAGPHGVLITRALNRKEIYRTYVGVDACMSALMRPGIYGAYHHITVPGKQAGGDTEIVDVVGSLCENNDKFAIQRELPRIVDGDLVCIHDTGAHGYSMGFNYNGRLRPQELLLHADGSVERIRRAETLSDYMATLFFPPDRLDANKLNRSAT
ncbi:MAG: diaminopimelate decarboxylase [Deltaproteobacteria bacterium]|nr:MAG: diaminopimelate decarboxylase [Deltaproteobacteria bacterium]